MVLEEAVRRVKLRVQPKNYQLFDLSVIKAWEPMKVAPLMGVSRARLAKERVGRALRQEVEQVRLELG